MIAEQKRQVAKSILEDFELQRLHAKTVEIYLAATPTVILKDGYVETVWIDETNRPILKKINELIKFLQQQEGGETPRVKP